MSGLTRLQHLVLWVADVERSVRFYCEVVGFEVQRRYPTAAFLKIPGTADDHHLGLFEQTGIRQPDERVARMYHAAWEVGELTDLARAKQRLIEARSLVGSSDHGTSLSPRRARVRDLLDGPRGRARWHPPARSRRRAGPPRARGSLGPGDHPCD